MIKSIKFMAAIALGLAVQSCDQKKEATTASGLKYTFLKSGEGDVAPDGHHMVLNMVYKDANDSVWMDTEERGMPLMMPKQDSIWRSGNGNIEAIFADLKKGDSITFKIPAGQLFKETFHAPLPEKIKADSEFTFYVGVVEVLAEEKIMAYRQQLMEAEQKKQAEKAVGQLKKDKKVIADYLVANNIDAQQTESGLSYVITEAGEGLNAEVGQTVKVNYTGRVLNGDYFDSSVKEVAEAQGLYDARREPYDPFSFLLGQGQVIKGWDEGIALLNKGAKATLYIPSPLAYGPQARGAHIPANSILIFDVELVDIVTADTSMEE